jgi:uncharacterized protein YggE
MNRTRNVLILGGLLLVAAAIAGVAQPNFGRSATPSSTTITVTGDGTVSATPDQASFDFGVQVTAATASEAISKDGQQEQAIVDALKKAGIAASDIQTTNVSLWPQTSSDGTVITGYQASNSVNVSAPVKQAGDLVDAAVGAGANNVDGPNLAVSDQTSSYAQALKLAVADAKTKAQAIADAAGLTLGAIVHVSDQSNSPTPIYAATDSLSAKSPIEAGTQQIQATVTVTYSAA